MHSQCSAPGDVLLYVQHVVHMTSQHLIHLHAWFLVAIILMAQLGLLLSLLPLLACCTAPYKCTVITTARDTPTLTGSLH